MPEQGRPLPERVMLDQREGMPAYSPSEMEQVEEYFGKPFQEIATSAKGMRVMVWLHLRRLGYDCSLEEVKDVLIEHPAPDPPAPAS
jgi:hypothetical protein